MCNKIKFKKAPGLDGPEVIRAAGEAEIERAYGYSMRYGFRMSTKWLDS